MAINTAKTALGFTEADLRAAAGDKSFERGVGYVRAVFELEAAGNRYTAMVRGTEDYQVELTLGGPDLAGDCDCPFGHEGFFCKHCVAVGLAILRSAQRSRQRAGAAPSARSARSARSAPSVPAQRTAKKEATGGAGEMPPDELRPNALASWLRARSRDDLLQLVREQIAEDAEWRRQLELRAACAEANVPMITARLDDLLDADNFAPYGYIEDGDSGRYARRVRQAAQIVNALVEAGKASGAVQVAEYALTATADACRNASDRSGRIAAAAADLAASHLAACRAAPPDREELAYFLAERMLAGDDVPPIAVEDYVDLLGSDGIAAIGVELGAAWRANPDGWNERLQLERLALAEGDVDAFVAIVAADLDDRGIGHMRIVYELDQVGRADDALAWAERGLREAGQPQAPLADYVVERYWALDRLADAVTVRRERFAAERDLRAYQLLREAAERAGTWPESREWALGLLRVDAANRSRSGGLPWRPGRPYSPLIDVLIDDGDLTAAWDAAPGAAADEQWLKLADLVARTRPADALEAYQRLIEPLRGQTGDVAYERMIRLLTSARECHRRLGTEETFSGYIRLLREDQKRKPKLMAMLKAHRL